MSEYIKIKIEANLSSTKQQFFSSKMQNEFVWRREMPFVYMSDLYHYVCKTSFVMFEYYFIPKGKTDN